MAHDNARFLSILYSTNMRSTGVSALSPSRPPNQPPLDLPVSRIARSHVLVFACSSVWMAASCLTVEDNFLTLYDSI
jgi:hypothetical protein